MINDFVGKKVLAVCSEFFVAPDAQLYRAIWGTLKGISKVDEHIGFAPNRPNVNWVYEIGDMIVYGCQIKIIILCPNEPSSGEVENWNNEKGTRFKTPNHIYRTT